MDILQPKKFNILLIGDSCIDEYQYGNVNRISPEAPVPIFEYTHSEFKNGMASNVHSNLKQLGCEVTFITSGQSRKIRFCDAKSKQQLLRVDHDNISEEEYSPPTDLSQYDAIVISDYDKGFISSQSINKVRKAFDGPIYIDTKKKDILFDNCFVKINEKEFKEATSISEAVQLIVTLGSKGARYKGKIFQGMKVELADVCGAGDTFLASLAYFHLEYGNIEKAIEMANVASAITVRHFGTYAPTKEEIYETIRAS